MDRVYFYDIQICLYGICNVYKFIDETEQYCA